MMRVVDTVFNRKRFFKICLILKRTQLPPPVGGKHHLPALRMVEVSPFGRDDALVVAPHLSRHCNFDVIPNECEGSYKQRLWLRFDGNY